MNPIKALRRALGRPKPLPEYAGLPLGYRFDVTTGKLEGRTDAHPRPGLYRSKWRLQLPGVPKSQQPLVSLVIAIPRPGT